MVVCRTRFTACAFPAFAVAALSIAGTDIASAYVGPSFMEVPGVVGGWQGENYKNWVRIDSHWWATRPDDYKLMRRGKPKMFYSGPFPPREGASSLAITLDKRNPALPELMRRCVNKVPVPELTYAESSMRSRSLREIGPRPADMPEHYEYKLKDVRFSDCPIVADAPEQGFVVTFGDIEWVNYKAEGDGKEFTLTPAALEPAKLAGKTKTFVVTWFAVAHDVSADQCSAMNTKPTEDDYYAFVSKADAAKERAQLASKGGVNYENGDMELRGPHKFNVCKLPGILRDPGLVSPQVKLARGLNLDGDDGSGDAPAGTCKHKNYMSADGRSGIDNQLFGVQGCMPGHQGHKGFLMQYRNEQRKNGLLSILVQISGIDQEQNDDRVDVALFYSKDPMAKNASGTQILADYTFRLTDNPEYTHYFARLPGKIVNGVVFTEQVKKVQVNPGIDTEVTLFDAAMRLEILPDGTLKGVLGGYEDWRRVMALNSSSNAESLYGFQCPAMYNALKRAADGMKDPVTGECNGISSAYDIEGVPAFIPPGQHDVLTSRAKGQPK